MKARRSATAPDAAEPVLDLSGEHAPLRHLLSDLWRSRDLIRVLARKDFFVQYRRASFGVAWALALPLLQAGVLAVVVPKIVRFGTPGAYITFVFSGTITWALFSGSLASGAGSIVDGQAVSTRVYFPRLVLPIVTVLAQLYSFLPGAAILALMTVVTGSAGARLLLLIPAILSAALLSVVFSCLLSALHVYFRDMRYIVQAALLAWFYVTPVIYPLTAVPALQHWLDINPVTGTVELFRAATVGADPQWGLAFISTCVWTLGLGVTALAVHRRYDRVFVDLL